ncbi:MAG TPA: NlpC/P60 family protein, partial [Phnomibacter sp.]|nr:NlpC/P60 family protein [Phnomibacter sp.]
MAFMVITAVAPLRADPSHRSEMISQLLFGELLEQLDVNGDFVKVKLKYDGYEGWCQRKQLVLLDGDEYPFVTRLSRHVTDTVIVNGTRIMLSPGSTCFVPDSSELLQVGPYALNFELSSHNTPVFKDASEAIIHYARQFLGTPYLWGGRSRYGMDCSGLTQTVYMLSGLFLPRDSGPQSRVG